MQFNVHLSLPQRLLSNSLIILFMFFAAISGFCKVYTLRPGIDGSSSGPIDQALKAKGIWNEPVIINGVKMQLKIGLINQRIDLFMESLHRVYPGAKFAANSNSLLIHQKFKDGSEKRVLLLYFGGGMPLVQFSIEIPHKLPEKFVWPAELPKTFDAKPRKYISLPKQNVVYGIFRTEAYRENAISEMGSKLQASGWKPLSNSLKSGQIGSGEMFYRKDPPGIMLINCNKNGVATCFFHPVAKK